MLSKRTEKSFKISHLIEIPEDLNEKPLDVKRGPFQLPQSTRVFENPAPIPIDIFIIIFSQAELKDVLSYTLVSGFFNSNVIWKGILGSQFPTWSEELELPKDENTNFKRVYMHMLYKLIFPYLYLKPAAKIDSMYSDHKINFAVLVKINAMNDEQKAVIGELLCFAMNHPLSSLLSFCMFGQSEEEKRMARAASALIKVALKKADNKVLEEFSCVLISDQENSKSELASIYDKLVEAQLVSQIVEQSEKERYMADRWLY